MKIDIPSTVIENEGYKCPWVTLSHRIQIYNVFGHNIHYLVIGISTLYQAFNVP